MVIVRQPLSSSFPRLKDFVCEWTGVDPASLADDNRFENSVLGYIKNSVAEYKKTNRRTHTVKLPYSPAPFLPVDLFHLVSNQPAYAEFLKWLTTHPKLCMSEVSSSSYRFFLDLDRVKISTEDPDTVTPSKVLEAMSSVSDALGLTRSSSGRFVVFHTPDPRTGFHVIWSNVLVKKELTSGPQWTMLVRKVQEALNEAGLSGSLKIDAECMKAGNVRLPFQHHPTKTGEPRLHEYSQFLAQDPPASIYQAMLSGSISITSHARNPITLHELLCGPREEPSSVRTFTVPLRVSNNALPPASVAPAATDNIPPFIRELLAKNGGVHLYSILNRYAYGTDFIKMDKLPVLSVQILADISESLRRNALFSWTADDIEQEIVCVMNNHFAHVGANLIVYRSWSIPNDSVVFSTMKVPDFVTKFESLRWSSSVEVENKNGEMVKRWKKFSITKLWLEHPARRCYQSAVYTPYPIQHARGHKADQINLYRGWRWTPEQLDLARQTATFTQRKCAAAFQEHIFKVICASDLEKFQFFMCLLAKKIRCPWFRPDSCFVITGPEGVGKSMLFERLLYFAAENGAKCTDINELFGQFNVQYRHKTIIFLDEASWAGAVSANTKLKNFLTSDETRTEQKYRDGERSPNFASVFIVSNSRVVMMQGENARRYLFYPTANTVSRGRQQDHHRYFEDLCKLDDSDHHGLKVWLAQFYDERLYETKLLDSYGRFNSPFFPSACMREMERQKCFSHASVTKFWERVLNRRYTYPPYLDHNLNSENASDFLFANREDKTAIVLEDGRRYEDLAETPDLERNHTLKAVMWEVRNPTWNHTTHWLATMNTKQLYEAYLEMRKIDLVPRKGLEDNVDLSSFLFTTKMIFREIMEGSEHPREFEYTVKAQWQTRSLGRVVSRDDTDWRSNYRLCSSRGACMDEPIHMISLGSWDECAQAFYNFTGLDVTSDKVHQKADVASRPSLYNPPWAATCLSYFNQ